jgi:hypothetical protein
MSEMVDCLVSYFSVKAHRDGMPLQYLCYRVIGGPGPTAQGGVAVITLVGTKNPSETELYHYLHAVQTGGPRAAVNAALNYLDAVHMKSDLARAQTEVRCTPCVVQADECEDLSIALPAASPPARRSRESNHGITVLGKPPRRGRSQLEGREPLS